MDASTRQPSRRTITRGAAWAAPVLVVGSAAPAMAASPPPPSISRTFQVGRSSSNCASGTQAIQVISDNSANYYYKIINATGYTISNVTASVLVEKAMVDKFTNPISWSSSSASWSNPTLDTTTTYTDPATGKAYYRYYSNLLTAVPAASGGTITLPPLTFTSSCHKTIYDNSVGVNGRGQATYNPGNQVITSVGAFRTV